jgi:hypothetical protein
MIVHFLHDMLVTDELPAALWLMGYIYFTSWLALGILLPYAMVACLLYSMIRFPETTLQYWLKAQCADEGFLVCPVPPPPAPDERLWMFFVRRSFHHALSALLGLCFVWLALIDSLAQQLEHLFVRPLLVLFLRFVWTVELLRLRLQFRLGRLRRVYVILVLGMLLATPDVHAFQSDSLTSVASPSPTVMNPDANAFTPEAAGLKTNKFGLSFDNVTDRDGKKPSKKPHVEDDDLGGLGSGGLGSGGLGSDGDGGPDGSGGSGPGVGKDDMVGSFLEALKQLMKSNKDDSDEDSFETTDPPGTVLASGLSLPAGFPRTKDMFVTSRVQISRHNRGKTVEARRKLRDRVCVKLDHTLKLTKWDEILDSRTDSDLGSAVISLQTQIDCVVEFCIINDIAYVCNMPDVDDMFDKQELMYCTSYKNVLTEYHSVELPQVKQYQALINLHCGMVDVESSEWLMKVLEKSTDPALLTVIKQIMSAWEPQERGGVSMFKAVVDKISSNTFEFLQAGVNYIIGFRLSKFDGENVIVANTRFMAVVTALPASSLPPKTVEFYLRGMSDCSSDEFKEVVSAQKGMLYTPWYKSFIRVEKVTIPQQLDEIGRTLEEKYTALTATGTWSGAHKKSSVFPALGAPVKSVGGQRKQKYASREEWFDAQTCRKCGKNHPTFAHDDPVGMRIKKPSATSNKKKLHFKTPQDKARFAKKAYQLYLDSFDGSTEPNMAEEYINMAGAGDVESAEAADEEEVQVNIGEVEDESDSDDDGITALVAAGLENLLKG